VLNGNTLSCFKRKGEKQPMHVYKLNEDCAIERLGTGRSLGFVLRGPGKMRLRLRAENAKDELEWLTTMERVIQHEVERHNLRPQRPNTRLWWAETKQGQFCFELDEHYDMRKTIGSGGYGVVVSAVDVRLGLKVAIKKVSSAFDDVLVAKRMAREIRLLRQFDHPNIVKLLDILPPPSMDKFDDIYMVLERMDTDLHHVIYSGQHLKEAHVQFFLYQLLCGLNCIHSSGVLHRDIKPANLLVNTTCDLKICDFGLARCTRLRQQPSLEKRGSSESQLTEYVVTRWWRAPEVFLEADYGEAIDMWSVGCVLAEMLLRKPLFMGTNTAQMLRLIVSFCGSDACSDVTFVQNRKARNYILELPHLPAMDLEAKFPDVCPEGRDLLSKMLQWNPSKRISVEEALGHPWLSRFRQEQYEQPSNIMLDLLAVENAPLTRSSLRRTIYSDICAFRPEYSASSGTVAAEDDDDDDDDDMVST
jgi:serine/threonine protein kinase